MCTKISTLKKTQLISDKKIMQVFSLCPQSWRSQRWVRRNWTGRRHSCWQKENKHTFHNRNGHLVGSSPCNPLLHSWPNNFDYSAILHIYLTAIRQSLLRNSSWILTRAETTCNIRMCQSTNLLRIACFLSALKLVPFMLGTVPMAK